MITNSVNWRKALPATFIGLGLGAMVVSIGADLLGLGGGGFGSKQIVLAIAGGLMFLVGVGLATPFGWNSVHHWRVRMSSDNHPVSVMLIAVWFGLIAGWSQTLVLLARKTISQEIIGKDYNFVWIIPLANLLLFIFLGLVLTLVNRFWPRIASLSVATFLLSFVAYLSLLLMFPQIALYASLLFALGLAAQTTRVATKRPLGFSRLVRYSVGWPIFLIGVTPGSHRYEENTDSEEEYVPARREFLVGAGAAIAATAIGMEGWFRISEQFQISALPASTAQARNVLLIVLDTVRAQSLSLHGYERATSPNLEILAKSGVQFKKAFSASPWTLPSHASMFTGQWPHNLSTHWLVPLDETYPTLAEILAAQGYMTAGFVANTAYCTREYGLNRGFQHYEDYVLTPETFVLSTSIGQNASETFKLQKNFANHENFGRKSAEKLNSDFLGWVSRNLNRAPYFAFLNYYDAHDPFFPPEEFALKFAPKMPWGHVTDEIAQTMPEDLIGELNDAYDGSIAYLDHHLGLLFDRLEELGALDNTLVIITSDHGEQFGDHGLMGHGNSLYSQLLHVPLLVQFPGKIPQNKVVHQPVSLQQLPASIMDLVGLGDRAHFPGRSLAQSWTSATDGNVEREETILSTALFSWDMLGVPTEKGRIFSLIKDNLHYIRNPSGREELFNITDDPFEENDLVEAEEYSSFVQQFQSTLAAMTDTV